MSRTPASARCSVRGIGVARERQDVDLALELLEPLLGATPKRCSSSMTTSPRSLNRTSFDSRRCVPMTMSTAPSARPCDGLVLLGLRDEAREQLDLDRERPESRAERRVVLRREDGRRHEHRDLLAVLDRLERGPDRDLGLAVADVADDEPVHRPDGLHVVLDLDGRAELVGRLLVRERGLHLALPGRVAGVGVARRRRARAAYSASSSSARSPTAFRTRCFVRSHSVPPSFESVRALAAGVARDPPDLLDRARRSGPGPGTRARGSRARRPCRSCAGASARSGRCRGRCGRRGRPASVARGCRAARRAASPSAGGRGRCRTARDR